MELAELEMKDVEELRKIGDDIGILNAHEMERQDIILKILELQGDTGILQRAGGILEMTDEGYGFLRRNRFSRSSEDIYVSQSQIRRFSLRVGDYIEGTIRPAKENERYYSLLKIEAVNGQNPEVSKGRVHFDDLTPVYPNFRLTLEHEPNEISTRIIDIIAPIGKGQRGLIVSPPKAGKTILLKKIANAITTNYPDIVVLALLIDERPEEVTDFRKSVKGEVISSTFDERPENHIEVAELVIERAKRMVEGGYDVFILLDSITRLARAYNLVAPSSGKTLTGGLDPSAIIQPKRFLGAARNIENGGSLTIIATALVETGSRLDDIIFEEFKGTGNMELQLSRLLANKRIFPAIDILRSGTRHEELLYSEFELEKVWALRRILSGMSEVDCAELMVERIKRSKKNKDFLKTVQPVGN